MQQNLGIPVLSGGFCLVNEEARAQALPPVCLCCAALQCFWKHVCGGAAAVAVLQPAAGSCSCRAGVQQWKVHAALSVIISFFKLALLKWCSVLL